MKFFYSLGVNAYVLGVHVASLWNKKARDWVRGRKNQWEKIEAFRGENVVWFHCASLGEFEQGRPVMERIKSERSCQIVVSFFSPSGYNVRKNYEGADLIFYLPKDSERNAKKLFDLLKPIQVYFVKYEFWANYIFESKTRKIPVYSIAALFRKDQMFFKSHGGFMRKVLASFDKILVQNESSQKLLASIKLDSVICGDTRFDRVLQNSEVVKEYPLIKQFCSTEKVLVCGSVWPEDIAVIAHVLATQKDVKIIAAPHELSESIYSLIEKSIQKKSVRYSGLDSESTNCELLIIDNVGMLMDIYQYGHFAYVGGGFKTGLHNILEPAAFGLPVIFGPKTDKFPEAKIFRDQKIGFEVSGKEAFQKVFNDVKSVDRKSEVLQFMKSQRGATELIVRETIA